MEGQAKGSATDVGEIPAELKEAAEAAREKMVEAIANHDDDSRQKYLEGGAISIDELRCA